MKVGQIIPAITLPAIDGSLFDNKSLIGKKYLLTFFRFATCPFCNLRMAQLVKAKSDFGDDFEIVAIFESNIAHLKEHATPHLAQFPILADETRQYYELFGVENSLLGMFKGMLLRLPTAIKGMCKGYIPRELSARALIMPLSLLVDEKGEIKAVYQGKDEGDHMPMAQVLAFSNNT
jgi:peroxiredoxin Q/BCP